MFRYKPRAYLGIQMDDKRNAANSNLLYQYKTSFVHNTGWE